MDEKYFLDLIRRNPVNRVILERLPALGLPDCWLVSGCLTHTVWNVEDGHDPGRGIKDYDLFYFDASDLSWDAEDRQIRRIARLFSDIDADIELRNQARVHLWFDERNGTSGYPVLKCATDGIDHFLQWATAVGIQTDGGGKTRVYAPYGLDHLAARLIRRNPKAVGPGSTYEEKARRWQALWPGLTIDPWDAPQGSPPANKNPRRKGRG